MKPQPIFNLPEIVKYSVLVLIIIYGVQFMLRLSAPDWSSWLGAIHLMIFESMLLIPEQVRNPELFNVFTSILPLATHGLLHGDLFHLLINCGFLMAFGSPLARRLSPLNWLFLLVGSVIGGGLCYTYLASDPYAPAIGISGGVSGLLGALLQPILWRRRNHNPPVESLFANRRNALMMLIVFLVFNGLSILMEGGVGKMGQIAWQAHIGGLIAGGLLYPIIWRIHDRNL